MTTLNASDETGHLANPPAPAPAPSPSLGGDPTMLGLPTFIVGSVALGLVLVGMVPATAVGASLPIILAATAAGCSCPRSGPQRSGRAPWRASSACSPASG